MWIEKLSHLSASQFLKFRGKFINYLFINLTNILIVWTGFGYDLAKRLDGLGFRVFAGCLNSNGKEAGELARSCSNLLHVVQLDVTKENQITAAKAYVETVHKNTGCGTFFKTHYCINMKWREIQMKAYQKWYQVINKMLITLLKFTVSFKIMQKKMN